MLLADNKFKIFKLKGEWNATNQSKENILALQAEIQNLNKRTRSRYHKINEYKTKKTQVEDSK